MKYNTWFFSLIMMLLGTSAYPQNKLSLNEQAKFYRMYVLQQCIYIGFDQDSVFDKDISIAIINDIAD